MQLDRFLAHEHIPLHRLLAHEQNYKHFLDKHERWLCFHKAKIINDKVELFMMMPAELLQALSKNKTRTLEATGINTSQPHILPKTPSPSPSVGIVSPHKLLSVKPQESQRAFKKRITANT